MSQEPDTLTSRSGTLCAAGQEPRIRLEEQPDDADDDGHHRESGTNQCHVGNSASGATAQARLTAEVPRPIDQATLGGGRTDTGG